MKLIAKQINLDRCEGIICQYHIMMVPRRLYTCEKILEEEGVFGYIVVDELPINLIAIENDILSLEANDFFANFYLHRDQTSLYDVSLSLVDIQKLYGRIANVLLLGECAQVVIIFIMLLLLRSTITTSFRGPKITFIIRIIIMCDCITPLCSQVTYEGLLDDTFAVKCGYVQLGPEITNQQKMTKVLLSNEDKIYSEIRDRHFSNVSSFLSAKAKELQQGYDKRMDLDISGMKDFVQKDLKNLKSQHNSLSIHVGASERMSQMKTKGEIDLLLKVEHSLLEGVDIKESIQFIEELISRQVNNNNIYNSNNNASYSYVTCVLLNEF
ncbi:hypothetical protein HELRODRAFT_91072 [Helobdella robusta]|uniref:Uncharacterized protein n=1 Tax=Helobdella robusta TaxID=6412 RepID=T1G7Z4_HELRO|nr:hypothetical protein HELRODRAFT_91072 [Helobdella robusta]ESN90080.1 hypothetical protein HELRODRAFT_91072 [Helobdella robusta]